jgi:hypothetical protein
MDLGESAAYLRHHLALAGREEPPLPMMPSPGCTASRTAFPGRSTTPGRLCSTIKSSQCSARQPNSRIGHRGPTALASFWSAVSSSHSRVSARAT